MTDHIRNDNFRLYRSHIHGPDGSPYMYRYIFQTPWFTLRAHKIMRPDLSEDLHDHPFNITSLLLGPYVEEVQAILREGNEGGEVCMPCRYGTPHPCVEHRKRILHRRFSINRILATKPHRIAELPEGPVWTLVLTGPYERKWGFWTAKGWMYWREHERADPNAPSSEDYNQT